MKLSDENKVYTCPECDSEHLSVSMRCSVNPNTNDVEVDWESDVGDSDKWSCDECGHSGFLPDVESLDESMTCALCGKVEAEVVEEPVFIKAIMICTKCRSAGCVKDERYCARCKKIVLAQIKARNDVYIPKRQYRTRDQMENIHETKCGIDY